MSVEELQRAIAQLSREDMATLARWFDEYRADQWDGQIEADIQAGSRANADFDAGRDTPL